MKTALFFLFLTTTTAISIVAQQPYTSVHHEQQTYYQKYGNLSEKQWDAIFETKQPGSYATHKTKSNCNLTYNVYGWHPYWVGTAYNNYDFDLLSTFSYFSYELNPSTGNYNSIHSWKTTPAITMAQAAGAKVELCVTNFGATNNTTFLTNPTARQTLIDSLIALLNFRNADGVNIDFEGIAGSDRNNLTSFMTQLSNQLKAAIPGASVTMATFAVDWNNVFDLPALNNVVDRFIIMGYDYYWSGSSNAGPVDPLYSGTKWANLNLVKTIDYYLNNGVTPSKLLIGLPYYGREWETVGNSVPSATTGNFNTAKIYNNVRNNTSGNYTNSQYDIHSETPYYVFQTGGNWRQTFIDDEIALGKRYDIVKQLEIGGIGIWALGYDDGYTELWDKIEEKFTDCSIIACGDTLYDKGGAMGRYNDNENYKVTISPTGASQVSFNFVEFDVELGFDSLFVYDGTTTSDPLLGAFSGTTLPSTITSSGNALTYKFKSDGATKGQGWKIIYQCILDTIKPTTAISASPTPFTTTNFTTSFTDADNVGGSGVIHQFFSVSDFNGIEWRANDTNGFFNDNFSTAIHTDWTATTGIWGIANAALQQTDQINANTNIYAPHNQNNATTFLYNYKAKISGSGTNKRAGFHFMSDNGALPNRGNSYFVWFRQDNAKLQFYKVTNDVFTLMKDVTYSFNANQTYDYKIVYNKTNGTIEVYVDDKFIDNWTDTTPLTVGDFISFRSGDCLYEIDDFQVYKNRTATEIITVGAAPTNDIRFENPTPTTPSGQIASIVIDAAHNVSLRAIEMVDVDFQTVSINELSTLLIEIYPNPANNTITLSGLPTNVTTTMAITDLAGRTVVAPTTSSTPQQQINITNLSSGIYFLQLSTTNGNKTIKFVKE